MPDHQAPNAETVEHLVRSKLAEALGGRRGIVESAVPTIAFTLLWVTTHELRLALTVSIGITVGLLIVRVIQRSSVQFVVNALFGIGIPPLRLEAVAGGAGDLSRFAGDYAWPDRRIEVTVTGPNLTITTGRGTTEAVPVDERIFVVDAADPDNPTVTFAEPDAAGRPRVLYVMLWGLPRTGVDDRWRVR